MTGNIWQSAFLAVLFALHPLHVQSVAWISERKDMLSAFFWMLTIGAYVRYARRPGWAAYVMVMFFFILGLMSKPMVVTLPFVLLLLDYWPLKRLRPDESGKNLRLKITGLLQEKIPLFILAAASAGITIIVQHQSGAVKSFDVIPLSDRLANALTSYVSYIIKFVYPLKLAAFYPYPNIVSGWKIVASIVMLSALSWTAIKLMHRKPWFFVGWLWFIGTLVPVIGLVQVGIQSMADRYMYLPMIGLLIPVTWEIPEILSKYHHRKVVLSVSAAFIIMSLFGISRFQLAFWTDTYTLFNRARTVTENNFFAYNVVGKELALKGDYKTAEKYLLTVLTIKPDDANALHGLGELAYHNKNYDKALSYYQKALLVRPNDNKIIYMIGELLYKSGKPDQAINYYSKVLISNPSDPKIYNKLGIVFLSKHSFDKARDQFKSAVRFNPGFDEAYYNIGLVASKQGKYNDALINYKKAISINPDYNIAHKSLADLLFSSGNMAQAFKHYSEALRINPDDASTHYNIGVILYQQQQIRESSKHFIKALQIDNTYEKAKIALTMTNNILGSNNIEKQEIKKSTP